MCRDCGSEWKLRGLAKRDFQHSKDGPEEITGHPKRRGNKQWCKGKAGRNHDWQYVVVREWMSNGTIHEKHVVEQEKRWVCQKCKKVCWGTPPPPTVSHKHDYSGTLIEEAWWGDYQTIYEVCTICGKRGKSLRFPD